MYRKFRGLLRVEVSYDAASPFFPTRSRLSPKASAHKSVQKMVKGWLVLVEVIADMWILLR